MFEGSILAYNPTLNEAEWVPARGLADDLSWAKERSAVALANYVDSSPSMDVVDELLPGQLTTWPTPSLAILSASSGVHGR